MSGWVWIAAHADGPTGHLHLARGPVYTIGWLTPDVPTRCGQHHPGEAPGNHSRLLMERCCGCCNRAGIPAGRGVHELQVAS